MSNQTTGTTTNMTKLVAWDVDFYESLSTEPCLVCLTEQELYLLRNVLRQMEWRTRWTSELGTPIPQISDIAERLGFKLSGNDCIDLCQAIIDCIEDPESGTLQAIINAVNSQTIEQLGDNANNQGDMILGDGENPTCDKDVLWGGVVNLIESANQNNIDTLEILEVATNQYEFLADVLTDVLGVEVPVADAMLDWVVWLQQSIQENYNAQITQEYLETIECGLFCLAKDDCVLTPSEIFGYFADRIGSTFTFQSAIGDVLLYLVSGSWSGTQIADVMFMSQFAFRALVGQWFTQIAFNTVDLDFRLGMNNPDNDWELLCDCQDEWEILFDFTVEPYPYTVVPFDASYPSTWVLGRGYVAGTDGNGARGGTGFVLPSEADLNWTEPVFDLTNTATNTRGVGVRLYSQTSSPWTGDLGGDVSVPQGSNSNYDVEYIADIDGVRTVMCFTGSRQGSGSKCDIDRLLLKGTGDNPFI